MRKFIFIATFLFLIFGLANVVHAQVVINEVLNNPQGDEDGAEWIELLNISSQPVSLNDCTLRLDDSVSSQKVVFDSEDFIDTYKIISWDSSWLNNSGDLVSLECPNISDSVAYGNQASAVVAAPGDGVSFGRSPDGTGSFVVLGSLTMGGPNSSPITTTPNPTNSPTLTPRPSNTPTLTPTVKPTSTITHSPTPKPKLTTTETDDSVLGSESESASDDSQPAAEPSFGIQKGDSVSQTITKVMSGKKGGKVPILAIVFIVVGLVLVGVSVFPFLKKLKSRYNSRKKNNDDF